VYQEKQQKKNKRKDATKKTDNNSKKPTGYTFAPTAPDPWLLPYTRISVPSFDFCNDNPRGHSSTNKSVFVWTPHGRQKLTSQLYVKASKGLKSQFTLPLYDIYDDEQNPKRKLKIELKNKQWFTDLEKVLLEEKGEASLWSSALITNDTSHLSFAHSNPSTQISGLALIGPWRREGLEDSLRKENYDNVAILSTKSLEEILELACGNIANVIGTNLPTKWAKQKHALTINMETDSPKRIKTNETETFALNSDGCIDLSNKYYARDARPLLPGCSCMVCKDIKFSRSYLHHLVIAKELLVEILLFGHNLHCLLLLIRSFRDSNNPRALKEFISRQLPSAS
jgi:hypothetical protein